MPFKKGKVQSSRASEALQQDQARKIKGADKFAIACFSTLQAAWHEVAIFHRPVCTSKDLLASIQINGLARVCNSFCKERATPDGADELLWDIQLRHVFPILPRNEDIDC